MQSTVGSRAKTIPLDKIRLDGDTQSRLSLDEDVIHEYAGLMSNGYQFPPLLVVFDGAAYWLVDGFHRRWAAIKSKLEKFKCVVVEGTREDARWLSYGCNKNHGLPRSNDDKKKAVIAALKHPQGAKKSDRQIAEHVGVSSNMVLKYREQLVSTAQVAQSPERTGRDGRTINTANIGKVKQEPVAAEPEPEELPLPQQPLVRREIPMHHPPAVRTSDTREKSPFAMLCHWWEQADSAAQTRFRLWIDGDCT